MLKEILKENSLKSCDIKQLNTIAQQIRDLIYCTVLNNGGHLASNLGAVEITLALHYVFNLETDRLIFDVGHQCYTHKILSGRLDKIDTLRKFGGLSGFPKREESVFDAFNTGHSSTAISAALGFAKARDLNGQKHEVIALVGDGAFGGGMVYEALGNLSSIDTKVIIVLNDNGMSINKTVGGISKHLSKLRVNLSYRKLKFGTKKVLSKIPLLGKALIKVLESFKGFISKFVLDKVSFFEHLGVKYVGPIDGNDIGELVKFLNKIKAMDQSVLLHIVTKKGKGSLSCEKKPESFHGVKGAGGKKISEYSQITGSKLIELANKNADVVVVTAAMQTAVGLDDFAKHFPERFIDVGICEAHAVTLCAALAASGKRPYFAVYSTFLQRGFDQILHDVSLQNLPVTFLIDRAGISGEDGETHQGVYDLSYLNLMPNLTIACPKDISEYAQMIEFSKSYNAPLAIRFCRESTNIFGKSKKITDTSWEILKEGTDKDIIIACGERMLARALKLCTENDATVINARFVKPIDQKMLDKYKDAKITVLEDNVKNGGLGSAILAYFSSQKICANVNLIAYEDGNIPQGDVKTLIKTYLKP